MINTQPKPARIEFGQVLRFHREHRSLTPRRVADMLGCSIADVEAFEAGRIVPEGKTWDKYKGIVNRQLPAYSELRLRAISEYQAERKLITDSMEHRMATPTGSNGHTKPPLAHKPFSGLAGVTLPQASSANIPAADARTVNPGHAVTYHNPPPDPVPVTKLPDAERARRTKEALAKLPKGWKQTEQINKRREMALSIIRQRPHIADNGADGLQEILRRTFGVGLSDVFVRELREQVRRELECEHKPTEPKLEAAPPPPPAPAPIKPAPAREPEATAAINEADLSTAVELVLGAIPGLRAFSIEVDEQGEATVNYTVREVKVTERGGSMKVGAKR